MSVGSPAVLVPFTRFVEYRRRRRPLAAAKDAAIVDASIDVGCTLDATAVASAGCGIAAPPIGGNVPRADLVVGDVDGEFGEDAGW